VIREVNEDQTGGVVRVVEFATTMIEEESDERVVGGEGGVVLTRTLRNRSSVETVTTPFGVTKTNSIFHAFVTRFLYQTQFVHSLRVDQKASLSLSRRE